MNGLGVYGPPTAVAMTGCTIGHVATKIGVAEERLKGELEFGQVLTEAEAATLRRWLWSAHSIHFVECWGFAVVLRADLGRWRLLARRPASPQKAGRA